jgi:hypothetical protein
LDGVLGERDYAGFLAFFAREGLVSLAACGWAARMFSVLLAVDPLEEGVEQEVTAKNANAQKYSERHGNLTRAVVNAKPGQGKSREGMGKKS